MDLDIQVSKLKPLKTNHLGQRYDLEDRLLKQFPQQIKSAEERIDWRQENCLPLAGIITLHLDNDTAGRLAAKTIKTSRVVERL